MEKHDTLVTSQSREQFITSIFASDGHASHVFSGFIAIALQISVVILLIVLLTIEVFVDSWASSGSNVHLIYISLVTILATIITSISISAIRKLWFQKFVLFNTESSSAVQSRIRVLAGLGGFKDQLGGWQVSLTFIMAGLVTTSIVAGLTPRSVVYISESNIGKIYTLIDYYCIDNLGERSVSGQWFSWTLPDGSKISYDQNPGVDSRTCEAGTATDFLLTAASRIRPWGVGYIMGDVQVSQSAAGVPWSSINGLDDVFGTTRDSNFLWASRCLPVLQSNPVRCSVTGVSTNISAGQLSVTKGDCKITGQTLQVNPAQDSAAVLGACTNNHTIGTATILLGATNADPNGTTHGVPNDSMAGYADYLARALDVVFPYGDSTYAVACEVDVTHAIRFQMLNYSRSDSLGKPQALSTTSKQLTETGFGYQVQAISKPSCGIHDTANIDIPINQILSNAALATGGGATWPLLAENMHYDGWFDTLTYVVSQSFNASKGGGAFKDSKNALEDALGLDIAIAMGLFWGGYTTASDPMWIESGTHAYTRIRLGPSSLWGLLYLIPPLFCCAVLLCLVLASLGHQWREKGYSPIRNSLFRLGIHSSQS